jgi:hypothetical protein
MHHKIFIFDFDRTLTNRIIMKEEVVCNEFMSTTEEENGSIFYDTVFKNFKHFAEVQIKKGNKIIILSHNMIYVIRTLLGILLPKKLLKQIPIITPEILGLTGVEIEQLKSYHDTNFKKNYISMLIKFYIIHNITAKDIILFDDDPANVESCKLLGIDVIQVFTNDDMSILKKYIN